MHGAFERAIMDHPKPHIQRIKDSKLIGRHGERCGWACALVMLNPFFGCDLGDSGKNRFFYVQPPLGAGTTPVEAYDDWHRLQTRL